MKVLFLILPCILIIAGCNQHNESITTSVSPDQTSESLLKPPAQSGPYVIRTEGLIEGLLYAVPDDKTGLTAFVGGDLEDACLGNPDPFDTVPLMDIRVPEDTNRIIRIQKGPVRVSIYKGVFSGGFCSFVFNNELVASGTGDFTWTDNDLLTFLTTDNINADAFGFQVQGNLTTPDDASVAFRVVSRAVWDGVDVNSFKAVNRVILH